MRFVVAFSAALAIAMASAPPALAGWLWPVDGEVITPYRNGGDPYAAGMHRGIDIAAPVGTRVVAAEGGRVSFAGVAGSSGLTVAVDSGALTAAYLHLSSASVRRGDPIAAGDPLGEVGLSGSSRSAAAPHLHFGVRETGTAHGYRDPLGLLGPRTPPREAPREPVAAPAPLPVVAPPETAPDPLPAPAPEPAPQPRPDPGRAPVPLPTPATEPVRVPAERPAGVRPRGAFGPAPGPVRRPAPTPRREPRSRVPGQGPRAQSRQPGGVPRRAERAPAPRTPHRSPLPWAAACAGLLLAAGALGLGRGRRPASSIGRPCPTTSRRPSTT